MAENLHTAIAVPYTLPAGASVAVVDATSTRTVTLPAGGVVRHFLASAFRTTLGTALGTEADPYEAGALLQLLLRAAGSNTWWTVAMGADARWRITYSGSGTGTLTWTSTVLAPLFGFAANVSLTTGQTATAAYGPTHWAASFAKVNDTGRTTMPVKVAGAEMEDGTVYAWLAPRQRTRRSFDLRFHPRTAALAASLGSFATPAYPTTLAKEASPTRDIAAGYALPWSLYETLRASAGCLVAVAFGNLQPLVAATESEFAEGYWDLATITRDGALAPFQPTNQQRMDWSGLALITKVNALNPSGMGSR